MRDRRDRRHRPETASLATALRCLPPPEVPGGLRARLVAAIPARDRPVSGRRYGSILARLAASAVLAASVVFLARPGPDPAPGLNRPAPSRPADTSTRFILEPALTLLTEESRPCDVLPPLPSW